MNNETYSYDIIPILIISGSYVLFKRKFPFFFFFIFFC